MTWQSKKHRENVANLPCSVCGESRQGYVCPHHIKGVGNMSGVGMKAPDWATMPLCAKCHNTMHGNPDIWPDQWEYIARTLGTLIESGKL